MPELRAAESSVIHEEGYPERKELLGKVALEICMEISEKFMRFMSLARY